MAAAAIETGFDLADVSNPEALRALPPGVQGLYFLDEARGVTPAFVARMTAIAGSPNLFGIYLADEPDPSRVSAEQLRSESDWIHAHMPGVKTFVVADNRGSDRNPDFQGYYTQDSTHIDLWGLDVYPFRAGGPPGDLSEVDRTVAAATRDIGVRPDQIVPVFQAFGDGAYRSGNGTPWSRPTPEQEQALMARWRQFAPQPVFDYAYAWGRQAGDRTLSDDDRLRAVFRQHNAEPCGPGG